MSKYGPKFDTQCGFESCTLCYPKPKPTVVKGIPGVGQAVIGGTPPKITVQLKAGIDGTLTERGNRYGDFTDNAFYAQSIKEIFQSSDKWDTLPTFACEALDQIATKISRILSGDCSYADNWHDIQGYAKMAEDRFKQETK